MLSVGMWSFSFSLEVLINDGGMTLFFLLMGLEIKRELFHGELVSMRKAALPLVAAMGGMVMPAGLYLLLCYGTPWVRGWGIPMATDIAFAIGVLSLLGRRIPSWVKIFLVSLAIIDDLGSILVIAVFYTQTISWVALGFATVVLFGLVILRWFQVRRTNFYLLFGLLLWGCLLGSGIHATLAGVLLAFLLPPRRKDHETAVAQLEHKLHHLVTFVVLPLFALCNASISLSKPIVSMIFTHRMPLAILLGLCVGKPLGVFGSVWLVTRKGWLSLPKQATWLQLFGCALLAGIGFTMSLLIAQLSFLDALVKEQAKIGILLGSCVSATFGILVLVKACSSNLREESMSNTRITERKLKHM